MLKEKKMIEINKIGNFTDIKIIDGDRGKNYPNGDDFKQEKYCLFLNAKNVTNNGFNFQETMFISKEKDELLRKGKVELDEIILTTRGTVGNVAYYSKDTPFKHIRINSGMVIIRVNDKSKINPRFLYWILRSKKMKEQILSVKTGTAQPQLPISLINTLKIIMPSKVTQDKIVKILDIIEEKTTANSVTNNNLLLIA